MDYHEDPDTGPTRREQGYIDLRDAALAQRDAAIALLRRLVVSIRLGSIDEAAVREAGRIVGEDGGR